MRFLVALSTAFLLTACGGSPPPTAAPEIEKIEVVATNPIVADFARSVGGDLVNVIELLSPGVDPHDFEPTARDLEALRKAQLIVRNGVGLEEWFDRTIESSDSKATIVDASVGVTLRQTAAGPDPHIWHSPVNARIMVSNITNALQALDAPNAAGYDAAERAYGAALDGLSRDIRRSIASLNDKRIVTNHDSLGYYASEFGLQVITTIIPSLDSQAEVTPAQIQEIVAKLNEAEVRVIFVETSATSDIAKTIAESAGVDIVEGEDSIYSDTLGDVDSTAGTYLEMERHNTNVIVNALR